MNAATDVSLETLCRTRMDAKREEEEAIARRRAIDKLIEEALPGAAEGTTSNKVGDIKVSVTRKMTRTVDADKLGAAWGELSENVQRSFKWKAELITKHFRALQELGNTEANEFITTKPASASVEVELIEKE